MQQTALTAPNVEDHFDLLSEAGSKGHTRGAYEMPAELVDCFWSVKQSEPQSDQAP